MQLRHKALLLVFATACSVNAAVAQLLEPAKWQFGAKRLNAQEAVVFMKATIDDGWHLYSQHVAEDGPQATEFTFSPGNDFKLVGKTAEPKAKVAFEPVFDMDVAYFESEVVFQQRIALAGGKPLVTGTVRYQVCNDTQCVPGEREFAIRIN